VSKGTENRYKASQCDTFESVRRGYGPNGLMRSNISGESLCDILCFEWEVAQAEGGSAAPNPSFARRGRVFPNYLGLSRCIQHDLGDLCVYALLDEPRLSDLLRRSVKRPGVGRMVGQVAVVAGLGLLPENLGADQRATRTEQRELNRSVANWDRLYGAL